MTNFWKMKKSAKLAVKCMKFVQTILNIGTTERNVAKQIKGWFLNHGASKLSFSPIVAFGSNSSNPHHSPTDRKLKETDVVVIDIGCVYKGCCSDITRTFLPKNSTSEEQKIYNIVLKANQEGIKAAKRANLTSDIDFISRSIIKDAGFDKYFIHSTGHGIGSKVHQKPYISPETSEFIPQKVFFTVEPGIYLPKKFGIRIEDTIYKHNNKVIVLTKKAPK